MRKPLGLILFLPLMSLTAMGQVSVVNLLTENRQNPVGIDVLQPRFTWQLESKKRNILQTAYELKVSLGRTQVWSTGKVISDQSVHIPYSGPDLHSEMQYTWQVRVWDNQGKASGWSRPALFQMGFLKQSDWKAKWIEPGYTEDPVMRPSPLMRKPFTLSKKIASATLYISAHGLYEAYINGQRVGDAYLTPGWTAYKTRIQYQVYDVADMLKPGENVIGAMLGNGWYRGIIGFADNINVYGKDIALLCQLNLTFTDGSKERVISDDSWKSATGQVRYAEIYNGETQDARLDKTGWNKAGYNDGDWSGVKVETNQVQELVATVNEPVKMHETFVPLIIFNTQKCDMVIDFGQNLVGWVRMKVSGKAGDTVVISHAEALDKYGNFYTKNLRAAKARDTYVLKGGGEETFEPHFTWHGFRYIRVKGYPGEIKPEDFTAVTLYSDMKPTGTLVTSNPLINQLQHNIQWGQKGNFLDVPTDCPQRDERLGWTGDAQVFSRTAAFNMNVNNFFAKWLKDLAADQVNGVVPFVIPNILGAATNSAGWADAATIIPWNMYLVYADKRLLAQQYNSMKAYVESIRRVAKNDLWNSGFHFGDWLFYRPEDDNDGRSAVTDKYLIAQCFYAHSTQLLIDAAHVLGNKEDSLFYSLLLRKIKEAFRNEYVTPNGRLVSGTQTAYVLALNFDMLPESMRPEAAKRLTDNVISYGTHLTTGFLGTPYICHVLTRFGYNDLAYRLLLQETYPSWLYPVKMGATTIWERWDGIKPDSTFENPSMNSLNHYAYGAIGDWMYRVMAGLDTYEDGVGYQHSMIRPHPGGGFTQVTASLETYYGLLKDTWKLDSAQWILDVTIPANTTSTVFIPAAAPDDIMEEGKSLASVQGLKIQGSDEGYVTVQLGSGSWHFVINRPKQADKVNYSEYKGRYAVEGGMIDMIEVSVDQGKLMLAAYGSKGELYPVKGEKDRFTAANGSVVVFQRNTGGKVESIRVDVVGMTFEGKKE